MVVVASFVSDMRKLEKRDVEKDRLWGKRVGKGSRWWIGWKKRPKSDSGV